MAGSLYMKLVTMDTKVWHYHKTRRLVAKDIPFRLVQHVEVLDNSFFHLSGLVGPGS